MKIKYDESTDVLNICFSGSSATQIRSEDPMVEVWFNGDNRLVELIVKKAKTRKNWPIQFEISKTTNQERVECEFLELVDRLVRESGRPDVFDSETWLKSWLETPTAALGGILLVERRLTGEEAYSPYRPGADRRKLTTQLLFVD